MGFFCYFPKEWKLIIAEWNASKDSKVAYDEWGVTINKFWKDASSIILDEYVPTLFNKELKEKTIIKKMKKNILDFKNKIIQQNNIIFNEAMETIENSYIKVVSNFLEEISKVRSNIRHNNHLLVKGEHHSLLLKKEIKFNRNKLKQKRSIQQTRNDHHKVSYIDVKRLFFYTHTHTLNKNYFQILNIIFFLFVTHRYN